MSKWQRQQDQRRKRMSQIIMGAVMVFIMTFSLIGYGQLQAGTHTDLLELNGQEFTASQEGFSTELDGRQLLFQSLPLGDEAPTMQFQDVYGNVAEVYYDPAALEALRAASATAITFDPMTPQPGIQIVEFVRFELATQMPNTYSGTLTTSPAYALPVVTCEQARPGVPVIQVLFANDTTNAGSVTAAGSCITIEGDIVGLLAAKDRILLTHYGMIGNE